MATEYAVDDLDYIDTTPIMAPGTVVAASDGNAYMYIKNNSATTTIEQYDAFQMETLTMRNGKAIICAAGAQGMPEGVMRNDLDPAEYGFACVGGVYTAKIGDTCSAGVGIEVSTNVAGSFDNIATAGYGGKFIALEADTETALVRILR